VARPLHHTRHGLPTADLIAGAERNSRTSFMGMSPLRRHTGRWSRRAAARPPCVMPLPNASSRPQSAGALREVLGSCTPVVA
jgi:hypothetical protein